MNTNADAVPSLLEPTPMKEGQFGGKEPEFRMDAYYYGFAPTGLLVIDRILSAVAYAGKSFHHTDCWTDQCTPYDHLRGETVTDWIQNAADDAADAIRRAPASEVQADHIADERAAFEEWCLTFCGVGVESLEQTVGGAYVSGYVDDMWDGWKARAAREAIEK